MPKLKTLIIDNYDSFTWNLYQYLGELGGEPLVRRNDEISFAEIEELRPTHVVISPGPGRPDDPAYFGVCAEVILNLSERVPTLGVCLGHQGICHVFGGRVIAAPEIMHGKTSEVRHDGSTLFRGLGNPLEVMRYHSLIAEEASLPKVLKATAKEVKSGIVMAVEHESRPLFGIQFHPESIGTPSGQTILKNFLAVRMKK